jgi:hypothetical protein
MVSSRIFRQRLALLMLKTTLGQSQRAHRTQGRGIGKGVVFTRQAIAPVCPTACISLGCVSALWLNCSI